MLLDFVTSRADVLHDCATAFDWGMEGVTNQDQMKDLYVVISSIRSSYSILMENLGEWLPTVLEFVDESALEPEQTLRQLWISLDLEDDLVNELLRFRLLSKHGKLFVRREFRDEVGLLDALHATLMGVWRFAKFSDSRWLSIGPSCRAVVSSVLCGVHALIQWCRRVKHCSEYYIHGVDRLSDQVRLTCIVGAIGSSVSEALLAEVLEGDRVMRNVEWFQDVVATENETIHNLRMDVWRLLGLAAPSSTPIELRAKSTRSSLVSCCSFE